MYLIQILLPVQDNQGRPFARASIEQVKRELTERFGGATAYLRAPAEGAWKGSRGAIDQDQIVILEVMVADLDRAWWANYRVELAQRFRQEEMVIRATSIEPL